MPIGTPFPKEGILLVICCIDFLVCHITLGLYVSLYDVITLRYCGLCGDTVSIMWSDAPWLWNAIKLWHSWESVNYALSPPLLQKAQGAAGGTCFTGLFEFVYLLHLSFAKLHVDRINNLPILPLFGLLLRKTPVPKIGSHHVLFIC